MPGPLEVVEDEHRDCGRREGHNGQGDHVDNERGYGDHGGDEHGDSDHDDGHHGHDGLAASRVWLGQVVTVHHHRQQEHQSQRPYRCG